MLNPRARTTNKGQIPVYNDLEIKLYHRFEEMQLEDIAIKSYNIVAQAMKIGDENIINFYDGNMKRMKRWVYYWMSRYKLPSVVQQESVRS